jgi:hypothetical protein
VPEVGDEIQVVGTKVDQAARSGVVTDVQGRMITVQWAAGNQTVFVPASGTLTVLGRADMRRTGTNARAKASRSARGAIPVRPSTMTKKAVRKTSVRKPADERVAKNATRKTPVRKPADKSLAKKATRKTPVRKPADKRVAKKATRKRVR